MLIKDKKIIEHIKKKQNLFIFNLIILKKTIKTLAYS